MRIFVQHIVIISLFLFPKIIFSQVKELTDTSKESTENTLSFEEYLGYVKKHHPIIKQAELSLSTGEANLLKARGGFDPKIEVDYDRKKFKKTEYFDKLNATFKIPTWYGVEFKANFEENTGEYLDPSFTVPEDGLYSAGVSLSLAQGFLINERMASLKKAQFFKEQSKANRDLLVNNLLFDASKAYFDWVEATNEQHIYETFLNNASTRLKAIERSVEEGEKAAIDITQATITLNNRKLNLEAAKLKRVKTSLSVSNFLWLDGVPMEIKEEIIPLLPEISNPEFENNISEKTLLEKHPKLLMLDAKINSLKVDRKLKRNKLLPKIDLQYNFLSQDYDQVNSFNTANYKSFVNFSFPLFLRKERGELKLTKIKLQDTNFERVATSLNLQNKVEAISAEIKSLDRQNSLIATIVIDYETLVKAEERKFFLGESSLFLINSQEQKLINSKLKKNKLIMKKLSTTVQFYNLLGVAETITEK
ncbi:MAG: transporter [Flavobacterium sp. MedPE-SWcel]|uniref:TolC family protein n=1 Tax=uncultured Flavobacterium sp. TaxID=165435 RepID=UPI000913E280|nr:TolC family protein [uncultured Flavobacterium sp.]OIQ18098.1 MAG: transporter [Flavobacterium sp. MedPE-SWcel]